MLLSAVSILVVAQSSSEIPEGLMNNRVYCVFVYMCYIIGLTVAVTGHLSPLIFIFCTIKLLHFIKQLRMNYVLFVAFISLRRIFRFAVLYPKVLLLFLS